MPSTLESLGCRRITEGAASTAWDAYCTPSSRGHAVSSNRVEPRRQRRARARIVRPVRGGAAGHHRNPPAAPSPEPAVRHESDLHARRERMQPLADDGETARRLVDGAIAIARELNVDFLEIRNAPAGEPGRRPASTRSRSLRVGGDRPRRRGQEAAWSRLRKENRRRVRRAEDAGLESTIGDDVDAFYPVYAASVKRLGSPPFSRRFFDVLRCRVRERAPDRFGTTRRDGGRRRPHVIVPRCLLQRFRGLSGRSVGSLSQSIPALGGDPGRLLF